MRPIFNYRLNLLQTKEKTYSLDRLRDFIMLHDEALCLAHKIGCYFRPGEDVKDSVYFHDGKQIQRREISRMGKMVVTYDWDTIFFKANRMGLVDQFIKHEDSTN